MSFLTIRRNAVDSDFFAQPVVRSGGAVHRPEALPRLAPFLAAEWVAARASLSPTRDAFSIGDSSRNMSRGFDVASFHGTRSHDRGTRAEWNQSPAPRRLSAWGSRRGQHLVDAHVSHLFSELIAEDSIAVAQQLVKGKGLPQLLSRPVVTENPVRSENAEVPIIREIMAATTMSSLFVALFALVASS